MRLIPSLLVLCFLFSQSCDMIQKSGEDVENNQSSENQTKKPEEVTEVKPVETKKIKPVRPAPKQIDSPPTPPTKNPVPSKPEKAGFTPQLLEAVKNWNVIPRSVFPLKSVTINKPLNFTAYSRTGQPVGTSLLPKGREVIALGHKGNLLTVSPSARGTMRATIAMDDTDFKDGVAYLFEMRKRQREDYAKRKAMKEQTALVAKANSSQEPKIKSPTSPKPSSSSSSLFEDLPSPGDFGHGKFCICSDCRTKRLAQTGSIK